jgi:ABC-2 type transport system permease protein
MSSVAIAFFLRGALEGLSYRMAFVLQALAAAIELLVLYYISRLIPPSPVHGMGAGYFSFAALGVVAATLLGASLMGVVRPLREGQLTGTLERWIAAPVSGIWLPGLLALWPTCYEAAKVCLVLGVAGALGLPVPATQWGTLVTILALTLLALFPFGVLSACWVLLFKRGDPIAHLVALASTTFGGVYFPVELLPRVLERASGLLPLTHATRALRGAVLDHQRLWELCPHLLPLVGFAGIGIPGSLLVFHLALGRARRLGTITGY